jgi:hypothetical protein
MLVPHFSGCFLLTASLGRRSLSVSRNFPHDAIPVQNNKRSLRGAYTALQPDGWLYSRPWVFPSFISRGAPYQAAREASTSEGSKLNTRILPAPRNLLQLLGSFTCPKVGTWGRFFNFPSEGRHAEDFYIRKIQRLRPGLNPRTREPEATEAVLKFLEVIPANSGTFLKL